MARGSTCIKACSVWLIVKGGCEGERLGSRCCYDSFAVELSARGAHSVSNALIAGQVAVVNWWSSEAKRGLTAKMQQRVILLT